LIQFFNQDTPFSIENEQEISSWILSTFHKESITKEIELSIIFCNDDALLEINKQFLNHDYYTDIITFPIEETNTVFEAELYISIDRVKENAQDLSKPFQNELNRVIIHGVLHLCGYGDKTPEEIKIMRLKEDFYIKLTSK
jgi:probable rRNA maturation factor